MQPLEITHLLEDACDVTTPSLEGHCDIYSEASIEECVVLEPLGEYDAVDIEDSTLEIVLYSLSILSDDSRTNRYEEGKSDTNPVAKILITQESSKGDIHSCFVIE